MFMHKWDLIILHFELDWEFVTESMITTNEFADGTQIFQSKPVLEITFSSERETNFERVFTNGNYETDFDDDSEIYSDEE
jgi:hypothetical protein